MYDINYQSFSADCGKRSTSELVKALGQVAAKDKPPCKSAGKKHKNKGDERKIIRRVKACGSKAGICNLSHKLDSLCYSK